MKDKAGDFNNGPWVRLEYDFIADAQAAWPGIVVNRVTGVHVWCANNGKVRVDGLTFSNSLTVEVV